MEESLRVARAQYDASARVIPPKGTWEDREKEIRAIYANMAGMNQIQKEEYLRGMADNNRNMLQAMRDQLDKAIAMHPENKNGQGRKNQKRS